MPAAFSSLANINKVPAADGIVLNRVTISEKGSKKKKPTQGQPMPSEKY